jgi:hypothetical protein
MCDYSLHNVASRPAKVGDKLVTSEFAGTVSHGFAGIGEANIAVCVLPGTEIAFDDEVKYRSFLFSKNTAQKTAVFRQINTHKPATYHDALEFADGTTVLLNRLCLGQYATVLQLPASSHANREGTQPHRRAMTSSSAAQDEAQCDVAVVTGAV